MAQLSGLEIESKCLFSCGFLIYDVRPPPERRQQHAFIGSIDSLSAKRILVVGTDCAQGKRTITDLLFKTLNNTKINGAMIVTGQTGIMQEVHYGVCPDACSIVYAIGAIEQVIPRCREEQQPGVILIEGQSSARHPALLGGRLFLKEVGRSSS